MASRANSGPQNLLDAIRPSEEDGPLISAVLSTYGLSLDQPNFFEHDFLPTMLGLGGVRDRGYTAPITLERKLAETYCALICDAHALVGGVRPSLRIDVVPLARPRQHAKIVLLHHRNQVRLIVSSANLTHEGYRSQREVAAVLDFRPDRGLPPEILSNFVHDWLTVLGPAVPDRLRSALEGATTAAAAWTTDIVRSDSTTVRVALGGGTVPLWRQFVDAWPVREPVLSWQICSPFWPGPESAQTPFEAIAQGLEQRGASLEHAELEAICVADGVGDRARPTFPFPLLHGLRERGFPVGQGRIVPARLETLPEEVPEGKAEGHRQLHAKLMVLRGPQTVVALIGSANFTNPGLGVAGLANLEAAVLVTCPAKTFREDAWRPPLVLAGAVDWSTAGSEAFAPVAAEPDALLEWPLHVIRAELEVDWECVSQFSGYLNLEFSERDFVPTSVYLRPADGSGAAIELAQIANYPTNTGICKVPLASGAVSRLLLERTIQIRWSDPPQVAEFPINISESTKAGLPSILGANPDEQQLLAYFHGRISEDDLLELLQLRLQREASETVTEDRSPPRDLQSYLVRDFVECLQGMAKALASSAQSSPRALEATLLGEFSTYALAREVLVALQNGRRSPVAAAFQLTELVRIVDEFPLPTEAPEWETLAILKQRSVERLLGIVSQATHVAAFASALRDKHIEQYVQASLRSNLAQRFLDAGMATTNPAVAIAEGCNDVSVVS